MFRTIRLFVAYLVIVMLLMKYPVTPVKLMRNVCSYENKECMSGRLMDQMGVVKMHRSESLSSH